MRFLFLLAALALLAACGGDADGETASNPKVDLAISVTTPSGKREVELECGPADERPACKGARNLAGFLAGKPPRNRVCTQVYGGPETGRIVGTIGDRKIDRRFRKTNGCEIADWKRAQPLLRLASP